VESKFCPRYCLPSARSMERSPSSAAEHLRVVRAEARPAPQLLREPGHGHNLVELGGVGEVRVVPVECRPANGAALVHALSLALSFLLALPLAYRGLVPRRDMALTPPT
jgi:hypothetical protein